MAKLFFAFEIASKRPFHKITKPHIAMTLSHYAMWAKQNLHAIKTIQTAKNLEKMADFMDVIP